MPERETMPTEPGLKMLPGMMPILHSPGVMHARAVRPDQARLRADERALDLHHVQHRDALGDADDQRDLGVDRLADRIRGAGRRHIDHAGSAPVLARASATVSNTGRPEMRRAALARRDAAHHLGAVGDRLLGVERAVLAGETLADDLGGLVDQDGHATPAPATAPLLGVRIGPASASPGGGLHDGKLMAYPTSGFQRRARRKLLRPWAQQGIERPGPAREHLDGFAR